MRVQGWGQSFNPEDVPSLDLEQAQEHGYDRFLMRGLVDEVVFQATLAMAI
ncbi:MAG: hypothetical protein J7M15_02125 [Anaerolineae bacterium]|nr:hypothetical protein [Anaerolineae bacterium]